MSIVGTKGGSGVWQRIISEFPRHSVYIEPFWGRGAICRAKRPADVTIGIDLDPNAISDGKDLALMFHTDGIQWLRDYFRLDRPPVDSESPPRDGGTFGGHPLSSHFVYLDPPYLGCGLQYYTWFRRHLKRLRISETDWHQDLIELFLALPCPAAISGYHSSVYDDLCSKCQRIEIPTVNRAGQSCVEVLWMNYDEPVRYHDVRYVGAGRRDRERIKRRVKKWTDGFLRMGRAERQAVFESIREAYGED